jgi:hypothetical protein
MSSFTVGKLQIQILHKLSFFVYFTKVNHLTGGEICLVYSFYSKTSHLFTEPVRFLYNNIAFHLKTPLFMFTHKKIISNINRV